MAEPDDDSSRHPLLQLDEQRMRLKRQSGTLTGGSSPLKITTSLKDRGCPDTGRASSMSSDHEATPSPYSEQENRVAAADAVTPEETVLQAPYSPTSNPFGVRPNTRTPAGSLAAARRDSGGLPAAMPPLLAADAHMLTPDGAVAGEDESLRNQQQMAVMLPLSPVGGDAGAPSPPAAHSPGFSDMGDEEAQNWLTSPELEPRAVGTDAREAAQRLDVMYDEALAHTMRTAQARVGQPIDELPARERSADPDAVPQAPGSGPLPRLDEDEELEDDATGLAGRLPLPEFVGAEEQSPPLAWNQITSEYQTRLQSPSSGPFSSGLAWGGPPPAAAADSPEDQLSLGEADRVRQELLAQGDELRASLEAATTGIMALASAGGGNPDTLTPNTPMQADGGAFASPISTATSPASPDAAEAPTPAEMRSISRRHGAARSPARSAADAVLQALLAVAVLAAAAALSGHLPPLHGWGAAGRGGTARAVFPQSLAQAWHGARQAAASMPLLSVWLSPKTSTLLHPPAQQQPPQPPLKPHTLAQHLRRHAAVLWEAVQGTSMSSGHAADTAAQQQEQKEPPAPAAVAKPDATQPSPSAEQPQPQQPPTHDDAVKPAEPAAETSLGEPAAAPKSADATPADDDGIIWRLSTSPEPAAAEAEAGDEAAAGPAADEVAKPAAQAEAQPGGYPATGSMDQPAVAPSVNRAAAVAMACVAAFAALATSLLWRSYMAALAPALVPAEEVLAEAEEESDDAEDVSAEPMPSPGEESMPAPSLEVPPTRGRSIRARSAAAKSVPAAARPAARRRQLSSAPSASMQSGHTDVSLLHEAAEAPDSAEPSEAISLGGSRRAARHTAAAAAAASVGRATRSVSRAVSAAVSGLAGDSAAREEQGVVSQPVRSGAGARRSRTRRAA